MKKLLSILITIFIFASNVQYAHAKNFSDVSTEHPNYHAIQYLLETGIFQGYEDGTFRPDQAVNRAELIKILVFSRGLATEAVAYSDCFTDVEKSAWYAPYICYAKYSKGWVDGYPDGSFKPSQTVNRVEAIKMLANAYVFGSIPVKQEYDLPYKDTDSSAWYAPYLAWSLEKNLLEKSSGFLGISDGMSRAEVAEFIYRTQVLANLPPAEEYSGFLEEQFWNSHREKVPEVEAIVQTPSNQTIYEGFKFRLEIPSSNQNISDVFYINVKGDTVSGKIYSRKTNSGIESYTNTVFSLEGYNSKDKSIEFYYGWWTYPSIMVDFHTISYKGVLDDSNLTINTSTSYSVEYLPIETDDSFPKKGCLIKGDSSYFSGFRKTYYLPSHRSYSDISSPDNIRWLCSEEEATAYGYTKALD